MKRDVDEVEKDLARLCKDLEAPGEKAGPEGAARVPASAQEEVAFLGFCRDVSSPAWGGSDRNGGTPTTLSAIDPYTHGEENRGRIQR